MSDFNNRSHETQERQFGEVSGAAPVRSPAQGALIGWK
jgi:hypothetical protein